MIRAALRRAWASSFGRPGCPEAPRTVIGRFSSTIHVSEADESFLSCGSYRRSEAWRIMDQGQWSPVQRDGATDDRKAGHFPLGSATKFHAESDIEIGN